MNHREQDVIEYLRAENRVLREELSKKRICSTMINGGAWLLCHQRHLHAWLNNVIGLGYEVL